MHTIYYPAVFHPEEDGGFSVSFPDIEGCFTQGDSISQAVEMAQDAIGLMLEDMKTVPAPSDPRNIQISTGDFFMVIPFDSAAYNRKFKPVKKTLSIPSWLNDAAEEAHINFSGVLQDALKAKLNLG